MQPRELQALLRIAGTSDSRYYLNGVFLDPRGYMVATDGTALLALRVAPFDGRPVIVPRAALERVREYAKPRSSFSIWADSISFRPRDGASSQSMAYAPIDGHYPDWQLIVPRAFVDALVWYDVEILERVRRALADLGRRTTLEMASTHQGGAGIAYSDSDVLAVVSSLTSSQRGTFNATAHVAQFLKPRGDK
jgi:DNA polymerase III sliding clamp (beta) subunit (PCNA family)